jgi:ABC-type uncharacterized transport system substrate-binding protein
MQVHRGSRFTRPVGMRTRRAWLKTAAQTAAAGLVAASPVRAAPQRWRIAHVMSFESPWRWTDGQFAGFQQALAAPDAEYGVFQMDVKRYREPAAKAERGRLAREWIEQWQPDLVYLSDDDAVAEVARPYAGRALPVVFSGVNRTLAEHGLAGAPNVTGVLEREHVVESLRLLRALVPPARRLAVICDRASIYWDAVIERVREQAAELPQIELAAVDRVTRYSDFQQRIEAYQRTVDAVLVLGVFGLQDGDGRSVPYTELARWMVAQSRLPDLSFWIDRVHYGTLASVTVSEHEQGRAAGRLAAAILREGRAPDSLPVRATTLGQPALNLARARQLGITVRSTELLSCEVVRRFAWDAA